MSINLTNRFEEATIFAIRLHGAQKRKGSETPYIAHLLSVAALVLENGGDEDMAIAALLHDAVEDQGGLKTLDGILKLFGSRVAGIVASCSDSITIPKPPWRNRKENYLSHLLEASWEVRLVSMADKLHNARSILRELHLDKVSIWEKFNGGKAGTLWYYRSLIKVFEQFERNYLLDELERVVSQIEMLAGCT